MNYGYGQLIAEHRTDDMNKYYCLTVSRRHAKIMGTRSPSFVVVVVVVVVVVFVAVSYTHLTLPTSCCV